MNKKKAQAVDLPKLTAMLRALGEMAATLPQAGKGVAIPQEARLYLGTTLVHHFQDPNQSGKMVGLSDVAIVERKQFEAHEYLVVSNGRAGDKKDVSIGSGFSLGQILQVLVQFVPALGTGPLGAVVGGMLGRRGVKPKARKKATKGRR